MKKISKIIATLLGVLTFSTTVTACTDNDKNSSAGKVTPIGTGDYVNYDDLEVDDVANIHERSISTTSHKLVTAGASEYVIVKDENPSSNVERAVNEFYVLFQEATGIKLPIVTDAGLTYTDNAKYISFGKTSVLESSSVNVDYATLGSQGYELITKGASLFVAGEDLGVLWGAYDLLDVLFDFTMYTDVYYTLNKNVKDLALPALDVKEVPDILYRKAPNGTIKGEALQRMRYNDADPIFSHGGGVHTWYSFISPEEYWEDHPSWFTLSKNQLCLTAGEYGGEEYQLLLEETVKKVKEVIDKEQEKNWLRFTQMDIVEWCNCDGCEEIIQRYGGANSATQILFVNDLAERIEAWLQSDEAGRNKGRDIQIVMFAYHMTEEAPTHKDANGEYVLNAPEMRLRDNVTVNIAHLFTNYTESLLDPVQKNTYELIKGWEPVSDNYICWAYDVYFGHYQMPRDTYNAMQSWVKTMYNMGAQWYWPQGNYQNPKSTAFDSVKSFIYSKLLWNVNADINALVDEFFTAVYREAAPIMQNAYWDVRAQMAYNRTELGYGDDQHKHSNGYTKRFCINLIDELERAKRVLKGYEKTDPDYYKKVTDEISYETIFPKYVLLKSYSGTFNSDEYNALVKDFKELISASAIRMTGEGAGKEMQKFLETLKLK